MVGAMARIDLRLESLEQTICPVTIDTIDDMCCQIAMKTSTDVLDLDAKLSTDRSYRKKLVSSC